MFKTIKTWIFVKLNKLTTNTLNLKKIIKKGWLCFISIKILILAVSLLIVFIYWNNTYMHFKTLLIVFFINIILFYLKISIIIHSVLSDCALLLALIMKPILTYIIPCLPILIVQYTNLLWVILNNWLCFYNEVLQIIILDINQINTSLQINLVYINIMYESNKINFKEWLIYTLFEYLHVFIKIIDTLITISLLLLNSIYSIFVDMIQVIFLYYECIIYFYKFIVQQLTSIQYSSKLNELNFLFTVKWVLPTNELLYNHLTSILKESTDIIVGYYTIYEIISLDNISIYVNNHYSWLIININKTSLILYKTTTLLFLTVIILYAIFRNINYKHILYICNIILLVLLILTIINYITYQGKVTIHSNILLNSTFFSVNLSTFVFDKLTLTFLITIYAISFAVNVYSYRYLSDSAFKENFLIWFSVFILSMVGVVSTANWFGLLLSWELLGISSFFLIGFFKNKPAALKSALKAFFFNKISDLFLLLACLVYYISYQTLNLTEQPSFNDLSEFIGIFICITAFVKSAQFIFYFWLPDSMEAPIPASALIHSATLVSAGIYLVLRFINLIEINNISQTLILIFSTTTISIIPFIAWQQTDIKKLLAYSTISNCGFIYLLIYLKLYNLALLYFMVHGLIKSFAFIVAGELILENKHQQDFRKWNNFTYYTKLLLFTLILLLLFLSGLPVSFVYTLKQTLINSNFINGFQYVTISIVLLMYTIGSYGYGLKLLYFFFYKNKNYKNLKVKHMTVDSKNTIIYGIFIFYMITLNLVILLNINTTSTITITLLWNWLFSIFFLIIILLLNKKNTWILIIQFLYFFLIFVLL